MHREELYEDGIVTESKGGIAVVRIFDSDKCEECSAKIYCKPGNSDERSLTVKDPFGAHPGDKVRISIRGSKILSASFLLYGIPLVLLLGGILIGVQIFNTNKELFSTLFSVGLILVYAFVLSVYSKKNKNKVSSYPEIIFVSHNNLNQT